MPVDPAYPPERIAFMLEDAQVPVLVTEQRLLDDLPDGKRFVVCLDSKLEVTDPDCDRNLNSRVRAANLAYVIYTSGSTGRPKGVQVTHSALANLLQSMRSLLSPSKHDTLLAVTTLSFDIAALEIFLPLIVGGRVELVDRDVAVDGATSANRLDDPRITFLQATPSTWRFAVEAGLARQADAHDALRWRSTATPLADRLTDKGAGDLEPLRSDPRSPRFGPPHARSNLGGEAPISIGQAIANTRL